MGIVILRDISLCLAVVGSVWFHCMPANASPPLASDNSQNLANVRIGEVPGRPIPATFMGLSHEWGNSQEFIGDSAVGINTIYRQLVSNLTAYDSGPIILRIGGNSTDTRGEPSAATVRPFAELARALGVHFYLGVNLRSGNVNLAMDQARAYLSQMPQGSVDAIEIGNEPDLYARGGKRSNTYSMPDYLAEFDLWKGNIMPVLPPGTRLMGPAWATSPFGASWGSSAMLSNFKTFAARESGVLAILCQHYYATNPAARPAEDFLLTPAAATEGPAGVASAVSIAHGYRIPFRMSEFNSISNTGVDGISNAFGAALWAVDTMFEYANEGVDGVNWEASDGNYDNPFYFTTSTSRGISTYTLRSVNPLYYGLLFFQAATGNGARVLPVNVTTHANLKAWATVDASGIPRLVIVNKDESSSGIVDVAVSGYSRASVLRLSAPSYKSTKGITFAGQTLDGSADGMLRGEKRVETIVASGGVFRIPMSIVGAALVVFEK